MNYIYKVLFGLLPVLVLFSSCKKEEKEGALKNDVIKKTVSPLLVGQRIEFIYAMGSLNGSLSNANVIASIPGAAGTGFGAGIWKTENGVDVETIVANNLNTIGANSSANFFVDLAAATLRFSYVIPESARGKEISFEFSSTNKAGDRANFKTPSYKISNMDMAVNIVMGNTATSPRYFSIADMRAYTLAEVEAGNLSAKIDFVYAYAANIPITQPTPGTAVYGNAFVSPSSTLFPPGFSIPASWTKNSTLMEKKFNLYDGQLRAEYLPAVDIFVDDIDLKGQQLSGALNYVLDVRQDGGAFMKTADGKYTAYVHIRPPFLPVVSHPAGTTLVGIKRYTNF